MVASLLSTCVGGFIAITGSVVGQRLQARNATKSRAEQYNREDRYRLHRERVDVYSQFYLDMKVLRRAVMRVDPAARATDQTAVDAQDTAWWTYAKMRIVGSTDVIIAARSMIVYISAAVSSDEFDLDQWSAMVATYRAAARRDLIGPAPSDVPELSGEADWARAILLPTPTEV